MTGEPERIIVACDLDGVMNDFLPVLLAHLNKSVANPCGRADILDLNLLPNRYAERNPEVSREEIRRLVQEFWSTPENALSVPLLLPTLSALRRIRGMARRLDVLTSRPGRGDDAVDALAKTWVDSYGIPYDRFVPTKDKIGYCRKERVTYLIEDGPTVALEAVQYGIRVFLIDAPYNADVEHGGIRRVENPVEIPDLLAEDLGIA